MISRINLCGCFDCGDVTEERMELKPSNVGIDDWKNQDILKNCREIKEQAKR
jgi:hypothetical protein